MKLQKNLYANKIFNDTRSNNKLLINFIDKAYELNSNNVIVNQYQLQIKSIIRYWISDKSENAENK